MRFHELLDDETKRKLHAAPVHRSTKKKKPKVRDTLSKRDWHDLMGSNRQTYKRKNGRVKAK